MNELIRSPRAKAILPGLLFVLLVLAVYADPLFFKRVFEGRDPIGYNYPIEKAVHDAWARGHLPVWISEISGGRPLLGNPNVGAFYPVRPLSALVSFPLAIRIFPILHWAIAGLGMLRLLKVFGVSRSGAWLGAVTFVFCGVSVSDVCYPNTQPGMALLPWIVAETASPRWTPRSRTVVLGALFGLYGLIGDAFSFVLAAAGCVLWIVSELPREEWIRRLLVLAAALPLAVLLAAPQIAASAAWIPQTNRAVLGLKLGEVLLFSLSPWRLLEFVIPFPFGPTWALENSRIWGWKLFGLKAVGFYSSLYAGALGAIAVVSIRKVRAPGARFTRALLVFGLLASVLPSFAPAAWRNVESPLPLRFPEKFAVSLALAVAIAVGIGVDDLRRRSRMPRWPLVVGGVLAILSLGAYFYPAASGRIAVGLIGADSFLSARAAAELATALCEAGLLWMATVIALEVWPREKNLRAVVVLAVLTAVPIVATRKIAPTYPEEEVLGPTAFARAIDRADPARLYRVFGEAAYRADSKLAFEHLSSDPSQSDSARRSWCEYTGALWGRGMVFNFDFDAGDLSRMESLRHLSAFAASYPDSASFFSSFGLRFAIRDKDQKPVSGYRETRISGIEAWDENPAALPTIRLATSWHEVGNPVDALRFMPRLGEGEIVIESGVGRAGHARAGTVRVVEQNPERMIVETSAPDPTWLFVLRGFWTERRVLVDGRETADSPAQLAFSAVPVPAGRHRVEWTELVTGWAASRFGPLAFLLASLAIVFTGRGGRKAA